MIQNVKRQPTEAQSVSKSKAKTSPERASIHILTHINQLLQHKDTKYTIHKTISHSIFHFTYIMQSAEIFCISTFHRPLYHYKLLSLQP